MISVIIISVFYPSYVCMCFHLSIGSSVRGQSAGLNSLTRRVYDQGPRSYLFHIKNWNAFSDNTIYSPKRSLAAGKSWVNILHFRKLF